MMRGLTSRPRPLCAMRGTEQRASLGGRLSSGRTTEQRERVVSRLDLCGAAAWGGRRPAAIETSRQSRRRGCLPPGAATCPRCSRLPLQRQSGRLSAVHEPRRAVQMPQMRSSGGEGNVRGNRDPRHDVEVEIYSAPSAGGSTGLAVALGGRLDGWKSGRSVEAAGFGGPLERRGAGVDRAWHEQVEPVEVLGDDVVARSEGAQRRRHQAGEAVAVHALRGRERVQGRLR
jgi:hypothetical protein